MTPECPLSPSGIHEVRLWDDPTCCHCGAPLPVIEPLPEPRTPSEARYMRLVCVPTPRGGKVGA